MVVYSVFAVLSDTSLHACVMLKTTNERSTQASLHVFPTLLQVQRSMQSKKQFRTV